MQIPPIKRLAASLVTLPAVGAALSPLTHGVATIFMLHRFAMPDRGIPGHDVARLARRLEFLRREKYRLVALDTLVAPPGGAPPVLRRTVAFTVDDGYRDFVDQAADVFARFDCPVTVFVVTGFLDGRVWLWWDRLAYLLERTAKRAVEVEVAGAPWRYRWQNARERAVVLDDMTERLKRVRHRDLCQTLEALPDLLDVPLPATSPAPSAPMTWEDARRLAASGGVSIGAHTVSHPILSQVSEAEARVEIHQSWQRVRAEIAAPSAVFCYPNGDVASFGQREKDAAREAGARAAVTTIQHYATRDGLTAPAQRYALPRFPYVEDRLTFLQVVSGVERAKQAIRRIWGHGHPPATLGGAADGR